MKHAIAGMMMLCWLGCDSGKAGDKAEMQASAGPEVKDATVVVPGTEARAVAEDKALAGPGTPTQPVVAAKVATPSAETVKTHGTAVKAGAVTADGSTPAAGAGDRVKAPEPDAPAPAGDGLTVAQKEGWATYTKGLQRKIDAVNSACGGKLSGSYDKSTYSNFDPIQDRTQSACEQSIGTLTSVCNTEEGKASVQKLTRATCKFSTTGTGVSVSGTALTVKIDPAKSAITGKAAGSYSWISAIKEVL